MPEVDTSASIPTPPATEKPSPFVPFVRTISSTRPPMSDCANFGRLTTCTSGERELESGQRSSKCKPKPFSSGKEATRGEARRGERTSFITVVDFFRAPIASALVTLTVGTSFTDTTMSFTLQSTRRKCAQF